MTQKIAPGTKVVVTGATGFTGVVLVKKLLEMKLDVCAVARRSSNIEPLSSLPITWVRGEIYDPLAIEKAMENAAYVFHLAAAFREAKSTKEDYRNVHLVSTQLLVKEARKNRDFQRMVHVSTAGVHGHIPNPPGDESSPFSPGDDYQCTKVEAERWLASEENRDFPYSIIRPCAIYGPGEKRLLKLYKMASSGIFPILGNGECCIILFTLRIW